MSLSESPSETSALSPQAALFAPQSRRCRSIEWQEPRLVTRAAMAMSGLEAMRAIRDGVLPPPPLAKLIGFTMAEVEPGLVVMELEPEQSLENTVGLLHGAVAAALLDTAMGCALSTHLPAGQGSVTLDLKLTYLRPLSVRSGTIRAEGRVIKLGRQSSYTEGFVRDGAGKLAVHGTATFSMIGGGPSQPRALPEDS
ncbi:PaaI family thioesterase [Rhodopseudomonas pseudopalustris]|uniref:PaaI family thioesterase n=1 Tax=Rhodopseudomonas pseudopalustris TaxID=1513892 RepID=UPI000B885160|nr:PaaI family thioesterase [Rhodopseudomonas pseudopalustris]